MPQACCKAGAKFNEAEWFQHIASLANVSDPRIPMPWFTVVAGGQFAENELYPASVSFADTGAASVAGAVATAQKVFGAFPQACVEPAEETTDEETGAVSGGGGGLASSERREQSATSSAPTYLLLRSHLLRSHLV